MIVIDIVGRVAWRIAIVHQCLVHNRHILLGIQHRLLPPGILPTVAEVIADACLSNLTTLRCHQHHAVGSSATIDSCRCCILQNLHRLYIRRVQVVDTTIHRHAVNDIQRIRAVHRSYTTNAHFRVRVRLSRRLRDLHARHLSLQCILNTRWLGQVQVVAAHFRDGSRHHAFLLYAVAHHHHVLQHFRILAQRYLHVAGSFQLLSQIAYIANDDSGSLVHVQRKLTIKVRDCSVLRVTLLNNRGAYHGISQIVNHRTRYSLGPRCRCHHQY